MTSFNFPPPPPPPPKPSPNMQSNDGFASRGSGINYQRGRGRGRGSSNNRYNGRGQGHRGGSSHNTTKRPTFRKFPKTPTNTPNRWVDVESGRAMGPAVGLDHPAGPTEFKFDGKLGESPLFQSDTKYFEEGYQPVADFIGELRRSETKGFAAEDLNPRPKAASNFQTQSQAQITLAFRPKDTSLKRQHSDDIETAGQPQPRYQPLPKADIPRAPRTQAAPAVPQFGSRVVFSQPQAVANSSISEGVLQSSTEPATKKQKTLTLGMTPKSAIPEDGDEDVDEEAAFVASDGPMCIEYKGKVLTLSTATDIKAWIAERKKNWPTNSRIAQREAEAKKQKAEQIAQRKKLYELRLEKQREEEKREKKKEEKRVKKEEKKNSKKEEPELLNEDEEREKREKKEERKLQKKQASDLQTEEEKRVKKEERKRDKKKAAELQEQTEARKKLEDSIKFKHASANRSETEAGLEESHDPSAAKTKQAEARKKVEESIKLKQASTNHPPSEPGSEESHNLSTAKFQLIEARKKVEESILRKQQAAATLTAAEAELKALKKAKKEARALKEAKKEAKTHKASIQRNEQASTNRTNLEPENKKSRNPSAAKVVRFEKPHTHAVHPSPPTSSTHNLKRKRNHEVHEDLDTPHDPKHARTRSTTKAPSTHKKPGSQKNNNNAPEELTSNSSSRRPAFRISAPYRKPRDCRYWVQTGSCRLGDQCKFHHAKAKKGKGASVKSTGVRGRKSLYGRMVEQQERGDEQGVLKEIIRLGRLGAFD